MHNKIMFGNSYKKKDLKKFPQFSVSHIFGSNGFFILQVPMWVKLHHQRRASGQEKKAPLIKYRSGRKFITNERILKVFSMNEVIQPK